MCEMIYLGFKGRYNLRLGEILQLTFRYISAVEKTGNKIGYELLQDKLSNAYTMYCIENSTILAGIVNMCAISNCFCIGGYSDIEFRNKVIDNMDDGSYIISFDMFNFLSEGLWPYFVKSFFKGLKIGKEAFISRLTIPLIKVKKYTNESEINKAKEKFCNELGKWLDFHMIGKIIYVNDENDNLEVCINISY